MPIWSPNKHLTPFWISFPEDNFFIKHFGVTAYSIEDAYTLLETAGYDFHLKAKRVEIVENISWDEIPSPEHIHPNMGPLMVRGGLVPTLKFEAMLK